MSFAEGYIDVATRIVEFREKYPSGSLQPADPTKPFTILEVDGAQFIVVVAAAYRSPDDLRPGIGMAQEQIPGRTPYTRGSELQNAETSAWGRAIVAALAADTKQGVASADEVRNRQAEREVSAPSVQERKTDAAWIENFRARITAATKPSELRGLQEEANVMWADHRLSRDDAAALKDEMKQRDAELRGALV
jgi:hypothetical protein